MEVSVWSPHKDSFYKCVCVMLFFVLKFLNKVNEVWDKKSMQHKWTYNPFFFLNDYMFCLMQIEKSLQIYYFLNKIKSIHFNCLYLFIYFTFKILIYNKNLKNLSNQAYITIPAIDKSVILMHLLNLSMGHPNFVLSAVPFVNYFTKKNHCQIRKSASYINGKRYGMKL